MTKHELLKQLQVIKKKQEESTTGYGIDDDHVEADSLLLDYIDDKAITDAFLSIERWYA